ncbi:MAG: hypothetical protein FJ265_12825 [Planctomycetes bacterium]|nr:hypothetical protein [Planctomycetota bacterium]
MRNHPIRRARRAPFLSTFLPALPALVALVASSGAGRAQAPCPGFGSVPVPALVEAGPPLPSCPGCPPAWPLWHLFTPGHRAPAPHAGFRPGDARELPRLLVAYRCTGFLLVPVLPVRVRTMGYVIDQPEAPCGS